ncbi:hypothetical protein IGI04_038431 [Brassica rapa subsp. trilocularis]|uniref:Sm domain-containing protein n=1 Tax=Brassica rapa subsp. trilocularis TaxID=1813537 RepID=A0ABQ7LP29_BRACM|nr:hypothetical protein IGI04_038431 [Brassica rapa subsp. trilocularis]
MSWAAPDDIFFSTSLAAYLDKKLLVLLRDGRKLMGLLRSFDQFGTFVDVEKEELPAQMVQVSEAEIKRAQKAEKEEMLPKGLMRKRMEFLDLD